MKDYDVSSVFEEMELELIRSMKRNLARHQKWENDEGINWTMWQAEQLKTLENFKRENKKIFNKKFSIVNMEIEEFLKNTYETSGLDQEKEILNAIKGNKKFKDIYEKGLEGSFFKLNKKKMNALINATTNDFKKAEHAMLRMTNDQYRKIIFKAQVMSNSGAFTLQQSIDAATKDFLKAGINCIQYKNGRRVNIASYAEMCLRTSTKRAMLVSEGDVRNAYGVHTVRISKYGGCSETCLPWQGRVYVDDEFSGGTKEEAKQKKLPLLSEAIEGGLFHPNCKHRSTTYFYDLKKEQGKLQDDGIENPPEEQEHKKNQLHIQQQKRLEEGSLDPQNIKEAKARKENWIEKDRTIGYNQPFESSYKEVAAIEETKNNMLQYVEKMQESGKINIELDEFTPCLRRLNDDTIVDTKLVIGTPSKNELKDWEFDWSKEEQNGYTVTQLYAEGDPRLQGLVATKARKDMYAIEVDIVESAPFNNPHNKKFVKKEYAGVGGHLFAEAVRQSYEAGYDGYITFTAKTNLVEYYKNELGATKVGNTQKMYIDERSAKKLYERYFKNK